MAYVLLCLNAHDTGVCGDFLRCKNTSLQSAVVVLARQLDCSIKTAQKLCDSARVFWLNSEQNFGKSGVLEKLGANGGAGGAGGGIADNNDAGTAKRASKRLILAGVNEQNLRGKILPLSAINKLVPLAKNQKIPADANLGVIVYEACALGLCCVFECADFAVLQKPAGLLSHPSGRASPPSASDEIWARWGAGAGVAHRLDAPTSGLLLVGKHPAALRALKAKFAAGSVHKEYFLLARGHFAADFCISLPLGLDERAQTLRNKMRPAQPFGQVAGAKAKSEFFLLSNGKFAGQNAAALRCVLHTGRQHQIRAHLAAVGSAVLGDAMYGVGDEFAAAVLDGCAQNASDVHAQFAGGRLLIDGAERLMLHSARLAFCYDGERYDFRSEADFANLLEQTEEK